ncbi:MAG TPA: hypothetical protein VGW78_06250 [Candidatus Babeliales bacterium]|nr:hypothetical protein [Candidatus Babeliales bacterium]
MHRFRYKNKKNKVRQLYDQKLYEKVFACIDKSLTKKETVIKESETIRTIVHTILDEL